MANSDKKPHLPGHIQAAIERNLQVQNRDAQGRPADSAGVPWKGRDLSGPGIDGSENPLHAFDTDTGLASPAWLDVIEKFKAGQVTERDVVRELPKVRVFAAVLPTVAETETHTHHRPDGSSFTVESDKAADVSLVSLQAADGRQALPVFSSIPLLTAWHSKARPVAVWLPRACLSAVDEGNDLVVIDPGAELTFVLRRPAVWALAQQKDWVPSYEDQELAESLNDISTLVPGMQQLMLGPGRGVGTTTTSGTRLAGGGSGPELALIAQPQENLDESSIKLMLATLESLIEDHPQLSRKADTVEIILGA